MARYWLWRMAAIWGFVVLVKVAVVGRRVLAAFCRGLCGVSLGGGFVAGWVGCGGQVLGLAPPGQCSSFARFEIMRDRAWFRAVLCPCSFAILSITAARRGIEGEHLGWTDHGSW